MEERQDNKYKIKKLLKVFDDISDMLGGAGVIDYIAITPNEFSIHINHGVSMILFDELIKLEPMIYLDSIFFNENNPQLIVANTALQDYRSQNANVMYLINFVKSAAEFICPCTGSEIHLLNNELKIFIDQVNLSHEEYIGVYNLIDQSTSIFKTVFDIQRPYISIMDRGESDE